MNIEVFTESMQGPPKSLNQRGQKIEENQDAFVARDLGDGRMLLAVMDGISNSPQGGSVAKRIAMRLTHWNPSEVEMTKDGLTSLIREMSQEEFSWGSTLTLAVIGAESGHGVVAWIGDSPTFVVRADNSAKTEALTRPHVDPFGHLTSYFPLDSDLPIDAAEFQLHPGDILVLATDGVATSRDAKKIDGLCRAQLGEIHLIPPAEVLRDDATFVAVRVY